MPLWLWFVDALALLVALAVVLLLVVVLRRRALQRSGGSFEMSVNRRPGPTSQGWSLGVAVYGEGQVEWYRTFSLSWRPRHVFPRGGVVIEPRRQPEGSESFVLHPGDVVVACSAPSGARQLAMSPTSLTGLLAWLESSPPGQGVSTVL